MKQLNKLLIAIATTILLLPAAGFAQAPSLGNLAGFALFSNIGPVANTGNSHVTGNVGTNVGASTGFGNVNGQMHDHDAVSILAAADLLLAYVQLDTAAVDFTHGDTLGNGDTLVPGVYRISSDAVLNQRLYLNAMGNPNAVFIFQIQGSLKATANAKVTLINAQVACNVFWKMEDTLNIGTGATMRGTFVVNNAPIIMSGNDTLEGRAFTTTGDVTVNTIEAAIPLGCGSPALTGPIAPGLGSAGCFALLAANGPVSNSDTTHLTGDVGTNVGTTTGFNPAFVNGTIHAAPDGTTASAATNLNSAYTYLDTIPYDIELLFPAQFGNGLTLTPHTYRMNAAATLTDTLYLDAQGDSMATFVIQINGAFTADTTSEIILMNGARARNIYWKIDNAVTLQDSTKFKGTIVADNGPVTLSRGVAIDGRALTLNGGITTTAVNISAAILPEAIVTGPVRVCVGSIIAMHGIDTGGTWVSSNTSIATVSSAGMVTGVAGGVDTIMYILTNACGSDTAMATITVDTFVTVAPIFGPSNVCVGSTITLTESTAGGFWIASNTNAAVASGSVTGVTAGLDTITYMVTNACGMDSATKVITIDTPGIAPITGPSSVCVGASLTLSNTTPGGVWSASNTNASVSGGVVTGVSAGTDTISYIVTNGCGADTATRVITINPAPNAGTITGVAVMCETGLVTMTTSGSGGTWSSSNTSIATVASSGNVAGVSAGSVTISYTATNSCGTDVATHALTVLALPDAGTITGPSAVCAGSSITLSTSATGGTWSASNGRATVSGAGVVTGISNGLDTIRYVVNNSCGTDTASKIISVDPAANAGSISGPSTICVAQSITFTTTGTGGVWSSTNSHATVSVSGSVTGVSAGIDTIRYIASSACGADTAAVVITINPLPNAGTITGPSGVCIGSSITLTAAASGGSWFATNANATVSGGVVNGVSAGLDTIQYVITSSCGSDTATKSINVAAPVNAGTITGPSSVCVGASITLTDAATGGTWSSTNSNATVSGGIVTGVSAGTDTIRYRVNNACGADTAFHVVTINPLPNAGTITGPSSVCIGDNITLVDAVSGGTWAATNSNATVSGGIVTGVTNGLDTIMYVFANSCGSDTATKIITVSPVPNAGTVTGPSNVCVGSTITLTNTTTGGTWSATNSNATVSGGIVTGMAAGTDTIRYVVTTGCGNDTATKTITVNPFPDAGSISGASSVCEGSSTTFTNIATGGSWSATNSTATISAAGVVTGISPGMDTIRYIVTNTCGSDTSSRRITIDTIPDAGIITGVTGICTGASITLTETATGGNWSATNSNASVSTTGVVTGISPGLDTIMYIVTNSCGADTAVRGVIVANTPNAGVIVGTSSVCAGSTIVLTDTAAGGSWSATNASATVSGGFVTGVTAGTDTIVYAVTNACAVAVTTKVVTIEPLPFAGNITGSSAVCVGSSITLADTVTGGTWSSSNATATVSGGIVTGITPGTDTIMYAVSNVCGTATATRIVTVNASPMLTSTTSPAPICDSSLFSYAPLADTLTATFKWLRPVAIGISNNVDSGTGNVNENLMNITNNPQVATYVYTVMANGCSSTQNVAVTVNPTPKLSSLMTDTICSGSPVNYIPTGFTSGSSFAWKRSYVAGISSDSASGSGTISETLTTSLTTPTNVTYAFICSANGCSFGQNVTIAVNPLPAAPVISIKSPAALCQGTMYQNFGADIPPTGTITYSWSAINAEVWATANNGQNALINFPNSGTANISLTTSAGVSTTLQCLNKTTYTVTVGNTLAETPEVAYFGYHFVCLRNDEDSYQWGYDSKATLDSTILPGEINQDYLNRTPDLANKYYWVMTGRGDCRQKTYYNPPTAVQNVNANGLTEINVYPNPADQLLTVEINTENTGDLQLIVLNMTGQKIAEATPLDNKATIDVSGFAQGFYTIICLKNNIRTGQVKFIKN